MPVPPNPYVKNKPTGVTYKFQVGDIVKILPTAGRWAEPSSGRNYSECKIIDKFYPTNFYSFCNRNPYD